MSAPGKDSGDFRRGTPGDGLRRGLLVLLLAAEAAAFMAVSAAGSVPRRSPAEMHRVDRALVIQFRLTGLALWPEAGYCRQPALSDLFSPHAFHPGSPDPLPSGSVVPPHPRAGFSFRAARGGGGGGP